MCIDCMCPQCHNAWEPNTKFELCEASKLYKGKIWLNRPCEACDEVVSIPFFVDSEWLNKTHLKFMEQVLKAFRGEDK